MKDVGGVVVMPLRWHIRQSCSTSNLLFNGALSETSLQLSVFRSFENVIPFKGPPNLLLLLSSLARKTSMIAWVASTKLSYDVSESSLYSRDR